MAYFYQHIKGLTSDGKIFKLNFNELDNTGTNILTIRSLLLKIQLIFTLIARLKDILVIKIIVVAIPQY